MVSGGSISQAIPNELQGCNSIDPHCSFNPTAPAFDSSQIVKIQLYPSKPAWKHPPLSKKISNSSLSLPSQVVLPKIPCSLSPTVDAGTPAKRAPSPVANGPTSLESSKLSGTLSFSLYPSLPHSFSHLTSLISQVLLLREMMPLFLIFEVTIRSYFYQHNPMD